MIACIILTVALLPLGFFLLGRISFCSALRLPPKCMPVSIIIPARNEQDNLPRLLQSIHAQGLDQIEIIVVDDGSTDATAAVAREHHATVISAPPLPPGWRGKTWACLHGATAASCNTLCFLDADTWFQPHGLAAILDRYATRPTVLSVLPFHVVHRPWEQLSAFFQLVMAAGSGAFTFPSIPPAGLFGQMLLIDRQVYFNVGGHEAVKGEVLENFHLARLLRRQAIPLCCLAGKQTLSMRMYPHGIKDLAAGWTKAFASGAARTPLPLLLLIIAWLCGLAIAPAALVRYPGMVSAAIYALAAMQVHILLRRLGTFPLYVAILYPLPLVAFFILFTGAITRRSVTWKGRTFDAAS